MASRDSLFELFNKTKGQIKTSVEKDLKEKIQIDRDEITKTPLPINTPPTNTEDSSIEQGNEVPDEDLEGDAEEEIDSVQQDNEDTLNTSSESLEIEFYCSNHLQSIQNGFEQLHILSTVFDDTGELNMSSESISTIKNCSFVTGHSFANSQFILNDQTYATESILDAIKSVIKWIIEKLIELANWVMDLISNLRRILSQSSMYERFKKGHQPQYVTITKYDEKLVDNYESIKEGMVGLQNRLKYMNMRYSVLVNKHANNAQAKEIFEKIDMYLRRATKYASKYTNKDSYIGFYSSIDLSRYSIIINNKIYSKKNNDIINITDAISTSKMTSEVLALVGDLFYDMYVSLRPFYEKAQDVLLNHTHDDLAHYLNDVGIYFSETIDHVFKYNLEIYDIFNTFYESNKKFASKDTQTQSYGVGHVSINTFKHTFTAYDKISVDMQTVKVASKSYIPFDDGVLMSKTEEINVNIRETIRTIFSSFNHSLNAMTSLAVHTNKGQKDMSSQVLFTNAREAVEFLNNLKYSQDIGSKTDYVEFEKRIISKMNILDRYAKDSKKHIDNSRKNIDIFTKKEINNLNIFSNGSNINNARLEQDIKEAIARSYLMINNYMLIKPILNSVMMYRYCANILRLRRNMEQELAVHSDKAHRAINHLLGVTDNIAMSFYNVRLLSEKLVEMGIDAQFMVDGFTKEMQYWGGILGDDRSYYYKKH